MESITKNRKTLIITFVVLIIALYIFMIAVPNIRSISTLKDDIKSIKSKYELSTVYEEKLSAMDSEKSVLAEKLLKLRLIYPPKIQKSDIYVLFNKLSEVSGVKFTNLNIVEAQEVLIPTEDQTSSSNKDNEALDPEKINITDIKIKKLSQELGIQPPDSGSESSKVLDSTSNIADGKPYVLSVQLKSIGTDAEYKEFFSQLAFIPGRINIKKYDATVGENGKLNVQFTLDFYGIKDNAATFLGYYPEESQNSSSPLGKSSIFKPYDESTAEEKNTSSEKNSKITYDFTMRIVPFGNRTAPATLSFSARSLVLGNTTPLIFGNNENIESAELYLSESQGKYFCKYKTQKEAFPDLKYSGLAEFKPYGSSIAVGIDSTKRISNQDKAGLKLKIFNNTSKPVSVEVLNDDTNSRRVKIEKGSGNINVLYK